MTRALTRRGLLAGAVLLTVPGCVPAPAPAPASTGSPGPGAHPGGTPAGAGAWQDELRELERGHRGRIGAWALHTGTGVFAGHRADERFPLLSTVKVAAAAAVLDRGGLDRRIRWNTADLMPHSPVTERHPGGGLTLAELCHAAITVSDNTAGNMLLREARGPAGVTAYLRRIGDDVTRSDRYETALNNWRPGEQRDTTTPAAMGRTLARLRQDWPQLEEWLRAATTGGKRIRAGLPGWTVGDKTGTGTAYGAANDVAVAHPPDGAPLVLSVFTHRADPAGRADETVIARVAAVLAGAVG